MPVDRTTGVRSITSRRRLTIGQGIPGGGRALPGLPESATSTVRTRTRPLSQTSPRTPTPQPRLGSPAGFALSLSRPVGSNRPVRAQPEYAGAAILRRGSFLNVIRDTELDERDHRVLKVLSSPDQYFNPRKHKELQLIVRPGPGLAAAIEQDPDLMRNRQELLNHLAITTKKALPGQSLVAALERQVGTGKMSFAEFSRKYDRQLSALSPEAQQRFAEHVPRVQDQFEKVEASQLLASVGTGLEEGSFFSNLAKDWGSLITGVVPGTVYLATHDPRETVPKIAGQYKEAYAPLFSGDFGEFAGKFQDHPLGYILDASALGSAVVGTSGRISAASAAVETSKRATTVLQRMSRVTKRVVNEKPKVLRERLATHADDLGDTELAAALRGTEFKNVSEIETFLKEGEGTSKALLKEFNKAPKSHDITEVGGEFTIHPSSVGTWEVRRHGRFVAINLPTERAAIEHAQQIATGLSGDALRTMLNPKKSKLRAATYGYLHPEVYGQTRGAFIDKLEQMRGEQHTLELEGIMDEVASVLDDPNLRLSRRSLRQVIDETKSDVQAAYNRYRQNPEVLRKTDPQMMKGRVGPTGVTTVVQTYREAMALVRTGAIYLRPAYIPNNWAGNTFMNLVHQGFLAPVNLGKTFVLSKHMDPRNRIAMQRAMGEHAAGAVLHGTGESMIAAASSPLVQKMGRIADIPFRESAFLHEARRLGYRKISQVDGLFTKARAGNMEALETVAKIGRRAQEEIVKFGRLNHVEKTVAQNVLFVYNWVRGATRYGLRFPSQHPIQSAASMAVSQIGNEWVEEELGGLPWFLLGSIPVGRAENGDPILINPFALNPLGTLADVAKAAIGSYKVLTGEPGAFDKFSESDVVDLTHPLIQEFLRAREGSSRGFGREIAETIAPVKLAQRLQHPESGGIFPYSRKEAVGAYVFGSVFPRRVSQEGITKALERELRGNPVALIPRQVKAYEKATGEKIDEKFIGELKGDLEALEDMKKFRRDYANDHGGHGFDNLPPINQAEAATIFLQQHGLMSAQEAMEIQAELDSGQLDDATMNELANAMWSSTGIGDIVAVWREQQRAIQGQKTTPRKG